MKAMGIVEALTNEDIYDIRLSCGGSKWLVWDSHRGYVVYQHKPHAPMPDVLYEGKDEMLAVSHLIEGEY